MSTAFFSAASMVVGQAEAKQATFLPEEVVASYQYVMGTWKTQGRIGEERSEGEVSFRWAPGRFSYVLFWSDGSHYTLYFDTSTPVRNKGSIPGKLTGIEQGKEFKNKISVERKGPGELVCRSQTADGKPFELTLSKISGPKAAKAKAKQD